MKIRTRTRQLGNGKWVGEFARGLFYWKWTAVDARDPNHMWQAGDIYYRHCHVETEQAARQALTNHLSARWGI